jgi:hypothetical protein
LTGLTVGGSKPRMRIRFWIFAALVLAALGAHLALLSPRVAQTAEDTLRTRLATASAAVRTQLELLDLRTSPRAAAVSPELGEALRASGDARPDDRAVRAAAALLQPEPDLLLVANARGAAVLRRGRALGVSDDANSLPGVHGALEGDASPRFAAYNGALYRTSPARVPGGGAVVVAGTLVDDRLASEIRSQVDADVTLLQNGAVVASSLPQDGRAAVSQWSRSPSVGYGVLAVRLPLVGTAVSGKLPVAGSGIPVRVAVRAALVPLESGLQAAVTIPAGPYLGWLGRYQAFYLVALALFVLGSLVWGIAAFRRPPAAAQRARKSTPPPRQEVALRAQASDAAADAQGEAPWEPVAPQDEIVEVSKPRVVSRRKPQLDSNANAAAETAIETATAAGTGDSAEPAWSAESFAGAAASDAPEFSFGAAAGAHDDSFAAVRRAGVNGVERFAEAEEPAQPGVPELGAGWEMPASGEPPSDAADPASNGEDHAAAQDDAPAPLDDAAASADDAPAPLDDAAAAAHDDAPAPIAAPPLDDSQPPPPPADAVAIDPDEAHFFETFQKFLALREQTGEPGTVSYEKFVAKLRKNREDLIAKHRAKGVRFSVYLKDGRAAIKASAIR